MRFYKLLPCKPEEVDDWTFDFLLTVHKSLAEDAHNDDFPEQKLRDRIEILGSYLSTLRNVRSAYQQKIDHQWKLYKKNNPRPEKGVTLWEETFDDQTVEEKRVCERVLGAIADVETRISGAQSYLKSLGQKET